MANVGLAQSLLSKAQSTAPGRARLALAAAIAQVPGWFDPTSAEPAADDYVTQQSNQFLWFQQVDFPYTFGSRADLEYKAGGNPSWNTDVNYRTMFMQSPYAAEVRALYEMAGLNLSADLKMLASAPRIAADPAAVGYLMENITYSGKIVDPILTLHTTGDGLLIPGHEAAYAATVRNAGTQDLLRQTYVHRAGHCSFTPGEMVSGLNTLIKRLDTGKWMDRNDSAEMNKFALHLGSDFNPMPPAYIPYTPAPFPRIFSAP
jgi:hypothetical protein